MARKNKFITSNTLIRSTFILVMLFVTVSIVLSIGFFKTNPYFSSTYIYSKIYALTTPFHSSDVLPTHLNGEDAVAVPVFVYHGIVRNPDRFSMTPETFKEQMEALKKDGYETVSIDDLTAFVRGTKKLPDRSFVLTFDDGRRDSFYGADPILKSLGYKAVMFTVVTDSLPEKNAKTSSYYLNKDELEIMKATGRWSIESHAIQKTGGFVPIDATGKQGNFLSNKMWLSDKARLETTDEYKARITEELVGSKKIFEDTLGIQVEAFAYPFGDYGQQTINFPDARKIISSLMKKTYDLGFHQIWPVDHEYSWNYVGDESTMLRRIEPSPLWSGAEFISVLHGGKEKALPYTDTFEVDNGWKRSWGAISLAKNKFAVGATKTSSGSFVFLDGAYLWKDYIYNVLTDWQKGGYFLLVGRFKNEFNYVSCSFSDRDVRIVETVNNENRTLIEQKNIFVMPKTNVEFSLLANKDMVQCYVNGNLVATAKGLNSDLSSGGVGIKTWDKDVNNSQISMKNISVVPVKTINGEIDLSTLPLKPLVALPVPVSPAKPTTATSTVTLPPKPAPAPVPEVPTPLGSGFYLSSTTAGLSNWKTLWGSTFVQDGVLHTSANASTTGSISILSGGTNWTDYTFNTRSDWFKGTTFTLVARFKDAKNYVSCTYSYYGSYVSLARVINNKNSSVGKSPRLSIPSVNPWLDKKFGMRVKGNSVSCLLDGETILQYTGTIPASGSVGFQTWDQAPNNTDIGVNEISVVPIK